MSTIVDHIDTTIAARIRGERASRRWSLDDLAERARVSKAMISKIERGETSPTAALLGRLSAAFGITLSAFFADTAPHAASAGRATALARSAAGHPPPGRGLADHSGRDDRVELRRALPCRFRASYSFVCGRLGARRAAHIVEGRVTHDLGPGDSLELGPPADCTFRNDGAAACRYLVVVLRR